MEIRPYRPLLDGNFRTYFLIKIYLINMMMVMYILLKDGSALANGYYIIRLIGGVVSLLCILLMAEILLSIVWNMWCFVRNKERNYRRVKKSLQGLQKATNKKNRAKLFRIEQELKQIEDEQRT